MGCSSSQTAPAWVPSTGCSPSGKGCSSMGPPRGHKPCQQTCSSVGSPLHRSWQQHALVRALHGVTASFGCIHLLQCGVLHGLQVDICSTVELDGLQGGSLPHQGLHHRLQGKNLQRLENLLPLLLH